MLNTLLLSTIETNSKFVNVKMLPIVEMNDSIHSMRMNMFFNSLEKVVLENKSDNPEKEISMERGIELVKQSQGYKTAITNVNISDETIAELIVERHHSFWD